MPDDAPTVLSAFATPIYRHLWPDSEAFNATLGALIESRRDDAPAGITRSLRGGWHSDMTLFEWPGAVIAELAARIYAGFEALTRATVSTAGSISGRLEMAGWANVLRRGGYHRVHNHAESIWSGVYYVRIDPSDPGCTDSGVLEFVDPRPGSGMVQTPGRPFGGNLPITPEAGLMLIFPSWLQHFVTPYMGPGERSSVSFNISLG